MKALLLLVLVACGAVKDLGGGAGLYLGTGEVFMCTDVPEAAAWPTWSDGLGDAELCWKNDDAAALEMSLEDAFGGAVSCSPTTRHLGPCLYHCGPGAGCNAKDGCWCE